MTATTAASLINAVNNLETPVRALNSPAGSEPEVPAVDAASYPEADANASQDPSAPFRQRLYLRWTIGDRVSDILARVRRMPKEYLS